MRTSGTFIRSIGVCLPDVVPVDRAIAEQRYPAGEAERFGVLGAAVAGDVPAPELALRAARNAFAAAGGHSPRELNLLLYADVWHQGPDGWQPQYYLQHHLTGGDVVAVEVRHGCCGLFSALLLASTYLRTCPPPGTALLVGADNHGTPLVDRWRTIEGTVLGDAGCALLLDTQGGPLELLAVNLASVPEAEAVNDGGEPLFPPAVTVGAALDFRGRNEEFRRRLFAAGGSAAMLAVQGKLLDLVGATLSEAGLQIGDIDRVAFPHNRRDDVEERGLNWLDLTIDQSTWDFGRTIGHMGVSDQFLALDHLLGTGQLAVGDHVLLVGIGAGTTIASAVVAVRASRPTPAREDR